MQLRKRILSISIVAALGVAGSAGAQEAAPAPAASQKKATELDTVVVKGIRGALQQSLDSKRDEVTRVEVITSEDIGKMPDKNVADSLSRLPGINISAASATEGAFDENDRVSMRGTSPSFTQTLIDGHNVASGDWFVLNQVQAVGRSVTYSLLPSELVDKVVVRKSSEAKLVEGGAVGNVDILTRNPVNFDTGFSVFGSAGMVYADLPGKSDPQISVLGNYKNEAGNFGLTVQAFSEERHLRRDGQELLGYEMIKPGSAVATAHPDLAGIYYPTLIGSALFEQERKRTGGMLTAQFKPSDTVELTAKYFQSDMKADNYNRNYMLWATHFLAQGAGQGPDPGYVIRDNTLVLANFTGAAGTKYGVYDQIARPGAKASTNFFTLGGKWDASENLTFSAEGGTSKGHGKSPTQNVAEWDVGIGTGAGWNMHGIGAVDWNLGTANTGAPGTPGTDVSLDWIFGDQDIDVVDKEQWLKVDGQLFFNGGALSSLDFGVRSAKHDRDNTHVTGQGPACLDASGNPVAFDWSQQYYCPVGSQSPFDPANWPQGYQNYPGDFADFGGSFPRNIWYFSPDQLAAFNRFTNRDPVARFRYSGAYALEEKSHAAYAQLNFKADRWSGNVGLRLVRTQEDVTTYTSTSATDPEAITTSAFGPYKLVHAKNSYNDLLPSANLKYDLNDDMVLRFAASRTITRPDYSALAGAVSLSQPADLDTGVGFGTGGNPELEPIRSTNLDATYEWYYAPRALLSAGLFYMNLDNYVALTQVRQSYRTFDLTHPNGVDVPYDVVIPVNSSAKVKGVELAWEAPIGQYFGAFANYTYADGETDTGEAMLGTSKNTYNVGGYFESRAFSARVNYTWRSHFYSGLDRNSAFFQDKVGNLSASMGYKFDDHLSLTLDAMNLNNPKTQYYAGSKERPRSIYESGRQYYLNFRFNY